MQFFNLFVILNFNGKKNPLARGLNTWKKSKFNLELLLRMNEHTKSWLAPG